MKKALHKYCKKVQKQLFCSIERKAELTNGLLNELSDNDWHGEATYSQIIAQYGTPEQMAEQLREAIPDEEYYASLASYKKKKHKIIVIIAAIAAVIILLLAGFLYLYISTDIAYSEEEIVTGVTFPEYPGQEIPAN